MVRPVRFVIGRMDGKICRAGAESHGQWERHVQLTEKTDAILDRRRSCRYSRIAVIPLKIPQADPGRKETGTLAANFTSTPSSLIR